MNELGVLCFMSVAGTRSFSITARELMITQQAVSRYIQGLEEELGFALLLRGYNAVHLTRAGEQVLRFLNETSEDLHALKRETSREAERLRVGVSQWLGQSAWLREAVRAHQRETATEEVLFYELSPEEIDTQCREGALDLLVTTRYALGNLRGPFREEALFTSPLLLVANDRMARRLGEAPPEGGPIHLAAGAGKDDEDGARLREQRMYGRMGRRVPAVEVLPNQGTVWLNVFMGGGVTFAAAHSGILDDGRFHTFPTGQTVEVVACHLGEGVRPSARRLAALLKKHGEVAV